MFDRVEKFEMTLEQQNEICKSVREWVMKEVDERLTREWYRKSIVDLMVEKIEAGEMAGLIEALVKKINSVQLKGGGSNS